jgi:hypothetical protein
LRLASGVVRCNGFSELYAKYKRSRSDFLPIQQLGEPGGLTSRAVKLLPPWPLTSAYPQAGKPSFQAFRISQEFLSIASFMPEQSDL